jgi:hypothetical protein
LGLAETADDTSGTARSATGFTTTEALLAFVGDDTLFVFGAGICAFGSEAAGEAVWGAFPAGAAEGAGWGAGFDAGTAALATGAGFTVVLVDGAFLGFICSISIIPEATLN